MWSASGVMVMQFVEVKVKVEVRRVGRLVTRYNQDMDVQT